MHIEVTNFLTLRESAFGMLRINGEFQCFTLQDALYRTSTMVQGERIPAGTYGIILRKFGRMHLEYSGRFADMHRGMLQLDDVPRFTDVLIHIGNTVQDTRGCLLVGERVDMVGRIEASERAYRLLYKKVVAALTDGELVTIKVD